MPRHLTVGCGTGGVAAKVGRGRVYVWRPCQQAGVASRRSSSALLAGDADPDRRGSSCKKPLTAPPAVSPWGLRVAASAPIVPVYVPAASRRADMTREMGYGEEKGGESLLSAIIN